MQDILGYPEWDPEAKGHTNPGERKVRSSDRDLFMS